MAKYHLFPTAAMAMLGLYGCSPKQNGSPNIIFILADDLGYGDVSCYNSSPIVLTPNIDRIAAEGVQMTQAYASPVSSPTRTSFLTGSFPARKGVYGNPEGTAPGIGPLRDSFTGHLKELGYNTAWVGKWHQGWDVSNYPANNGFDYTYGFLGGMHDYYLPEEGSHYNGGPYSKQAFVFDNFRPVKDMKYLTEELTDRAISFIRSQKQKPFYLYLAYNAPHTPLQAPENLIVKYLDKGVEPLAAVRFAMIDFMDTQIGRILEELDNKKLAENTIVVFMSDNGAEDEINNGGLRGKKMTMWEGGIRVPLVVRWPSRMKPSIQSNSICSIIDMGATFIGAASGNDNLCYGDGKNIVPYICGEKDGNVHDTLFFALQPRYKDSEGISAGCMNLLGVRLNEWKLVIDKGRNINALYNLQIDTSETTDLSEEYPDMKQKLFGMAEEFISSCPGSSSRQYMRDTRAVGDKAKRDSVIALCNRLRPVLQSTENTK